MTYVSVDVDLDDVLNGLSSRETQKLVDDLYEDGYYQSKLEAKMDDDNNSAISPNEQLFRAEISKLRLNYLNLSNSEIEILMAISKRF